MEYAELGRSGVKVSKLCLGMMSYGTQDWQKWVLPAQLEPRTQSHEMANPALKQVVTKLAPARTKLQLRKATARHLRSVQRPTDRVKSYFEHDPVRYAA